MKKEKISKHSKGFYITIWGFIALLVLGIGVYATNIFDSNGITVPKMNNITYVTKCITADCSVDINNAIQNTYKGGVVRITGTTYNIANTIQAKEGVTLIGDNGLEGGGGSWYAKDTVTRLKWTGADGGIMFNATELGSDPISTFGLNSIEFDGNYKAGYGVYRQDNTVDKLRHLNLKDLTFTHINGSAFYFGNKVDDTDMYNVFIQDGGANSVGIDSPNTEIRMFGGAINNQNIALYLRGNYAMSTIMNGVVFGGNTNDLIINTNYSYTYPIRFWDCWFEPSGAQQQNIVKVIGNTTLYGIEFYGSNIGTDQLNGAVIDVNQSIKSSVSFIGGRSYIPTTSYIYGNENTSLVFINHEQDPNPFTVIGTIPMSFSGNRVLLGSMTKIGNNLLELSDPTSAGMTFTKTGSSSGTGSIYTDSGNFNIIGKGNSPNRQTKFYDKILVTNMTGTGNAVVCVDSNGVLFRNGTSGTCA